MNPFLHYLYAVSVVIETLEFVLILLVRGLMEILTAVLIAPFFVLLLVWEDVRDQVRD